MQSTADPRSVGQVVRSFKGTRNSDRAVTGLWVPDFAIIDGSVYDLYTVILK